MTVHTSLDKVAKVFNGKTPSKTEQRDAGHPVLKIKDVSESGEFSGQFYSFVDHNMAEKFSQKFIQKGDVLILNAAHNADYVGSKVYQADRSVSGALPTGEWLIIRPNKREIDPDYLFFWVFSADTKFKIRNLVKGIHLYPRDVATIKLDLPPLLEQRRIAAILDKADTIRRKRQRAIELTEDFLRSAFLEMFGDPVTNPKEWPTYILGELMVDGPSNGLYRPASDYGRGTPIIRIDSFYNGEVTAVDKLKRVEIGESELRRFSVKENDILINRVNSKKFLGKSALVPNLSEPTVYESNMMRFSVDQNLVTPNYLIFLLQTSYIKNQVLNRSRDAVNQSSINQQDVKSLEVRLPPLDIQQKYAQLIEKKKVIVDRFAKSTEKVNNLFQSLNYSAFRGELMRETAEEVLKEAAAG